MGMSASQVRFLQLTSRKNDIGYQLTQLSNDKVSLARDMQKVSKEYQNALNQKVLKWSNNSGVTYIDLSYQNLMKPSLMNKNTAYLLTDTSDRVVVDSEYQKYAAMISPSGAAGGDWESVRTQVLSELVGVDASKIDSANSYQKTVWEKEAEINKLIEEEPQLPEKKGTLNNFLNYIGAASTGIDKTFSEGTDWATAYDKGATIDLGSKDVAANNLQKILDTIYASIEPYLIDDECKEKFKSNCETFMTENKTYLEGNDEKYKTSLESEHTSISGSSKNYTVSVVNLLEQIMTGVAETTTDNGNKMLVWADKKNSKYSEWQTEKDAWDKNYQNAQNDYDEAVKAKNQLFNADEESLIAFYDALFSSIAEKGWSYNPQINDNDYLNDMLQNNMLMLTTVDRDLEFDDGKYSWDNDYTTDIASNFTNIFTVNDSDAREDALIEYEHKKSIISEKESRIDTRMKNLETEQAAINQMLQGLEQVKNDNIERTMGWSA